MSENNKNGMVSLEAEDGSRLDFYVLEQTRFYGINYLLVTENAGDEDAEVYILKDLSEESSAEAVYEFVEDEEELDALAEVFGELLEDADIVD
ncbi:MAG: DUF1292 domain-containing protein [Lachnospiraceae bacterium]|nr:DUF1292 domain-containing protein [Lachnospiraceae bacterium]